MIKKLKNKYIIIFINKYFSSFLKGEKYFINIEKNCIFIFLKNLDIKLTIKVISGEKNNFISETDFINHKNIELLFNNLLRILNNKVEIPIYIKLGKKIDLEKNEKFVFFLGNDGNIDNFSNKDLKLLNIVNKIYTNNIIEIKKILNKLNYNIDVLDYKNIFLEKDLEVDKVLFFYGDYFEDRGNWYKVCKYLMNKNYSFKLYSFYSNFIEKYVLSYANYGNLFHLGFFDKEKYLLNKDFILEKVDIFLNNHKNIILNNIGEGEMLGKISCSIDFKNISNLIDLIESLKLKNDIQKYTFEIIYKIKGGYIKRIDKIDKINLLEKEKNISYISLFIYKSGYLKKEINFLGFNKKYSKKNQNNDFTFLSAPLSGNKDDFSKNVINNLQRAKYIFGESVEATKKFLKDLKIGIEEKKILYGDELILMEKYLKKNNKLDVFGSKIKYIPEIIPELKGLLDKEKDVYYITDGGVPCILDPGNLIKKYIGYYYNNYNIFLEKGASVIDTVLLSCVFSFKSIYWASLIYTVKPFYKILKNINFFKKEVDNNTLFIFYSFGKEFENDIKILIALFGKNVNMQIIGDIGSEREFNKLFLISEIYLDTKKYIVNNIDNIVYLLKF